MRPELIQATDLLRLNTPEAVEEALGLLQNTVYSFSMKVCGHPEDAEDTMQEVLYRSLGHLAKLHDPQALALWLYTVTRNRCWRMRRKRSHAPDHILSLDELMPSDEELGLLLRDAGEGPESNLLHAEQHHLLHQAILRIPATLRIVLVLHDMEELTTEQVAKVLDLKSGTVRIRLHRARLSVRREMSNLLSGRVEPLACDQMRLHIEGCPSCVVFLRNLRAAIDRCRSLGVPCDPAVAIRLRTILTREYLRLLAMPEARKTTKVL